MERWKGGVLRMRVWGGGVVLVLCAALLSVGMAVEAPETNAERVRADTTGRIEASNSVATEHGTVQFIGLQSQTPQEMLDTLRALSPEGNYILQCITTIERQLGYPDAMVYMQLGATPHFVVTVVAPEHESDVQFLDVPTTNPGLPPSWTAALADGGTERVARVGEEGGDGTVAADDSSTAREVPAMQAFAFLPVVEAYGAALRGEPSDALDRALRRERVDTVYVKRAFDFLQARTEASDLEHALRIARTDKDGPDRVIALSVLVNFPADERAWHTLARHVTDPFDPASMTAFRALTAMSRTDPPDVDWRPVARFLRANLAGTNQVITPFLLDVLRKTNVDPSLGADLVAGRPGERLLAHLQTTVQTTTSSIRPFLKHVSGVEGVDAWREWHAGLDEGE